MTCKGLFEKWKNSGHNLYGVLAGEMLTSYHVKMFEKLNVLSFSGESGLGSWKW